MFEHVFAVGNLDNPSVPGSCKNSTVTGNTSCGNTLQPMVKNKMSLKVMSESTSSSICPEDNHSIWTKRDSQLMPFKNQRDLS